MKLQSNRELDVTREKLRMLEEQYEAARQESDRDEEVRKAELQSLKKLRIAEKTTVAIWPWGTFPTCQARWNRAPLIVSAILINHLKEEIVRYESRMSAQSRGR